MAFLDVSDVLYDSDLTENIIVRRRPQNSNSYGRPSPDSVEIDYPTIAVVTSSNPNDLNRQDPDLEVASRTISVITDFKIRGQIEGYLPDVVVWRGNNFVVAYIDLYPQFGAGFYQAICTSMDRNDYSTDIATTGQLAFNSAKNSGNYYLCY